MKKKESLIIFIIVISTYYSVHAIGQKILQSPNGEIEVTLYTENELAYSVSYNGQEILKPSSIRLKVDGQWLGTKAQLKNAKSTELRDEVIPSWGIRSIIPENYNELVLNFKGAYSVIFRAYNNGIAYRFELKRKGEIIVEDELVAYNLPETYYALSHKVEHFQTSYERFYDYQPIDQIGDSLISLPLIIDGGKVKMAIAEADLFDYPGVYMKKDPKESVLVGHLPNAAKNTALAGWNNFNKKVTERENYLAKTVGNRVFPWRVLSIHEDEKGLADNNLVYLLSRPSKIDTDWIKPGQVAWDWWNNWNLTGVDFEAGVNNQTYEYFIDFASENKIPYVILDEGWSETDDLLNLKKEIDLKHLVSYAKERNVRLILWCVWHVLDRQLDEAMDMFEAMDIAGIKVDFIDRDDQFAINYYERIAREAAKRKLLVDFHGCSKPTGLHRTYPNVINYEGVRGNEYNKFSEEGISPQHKVDIVFTRMMAGPMDYTPGATRHSYKSFFKSSFSMPTSRGTRVNEMALFVLYYAPLQMLCDAPTAYEQNPEMLEFISQVPTTWDETIVLDAQLRETVTIARKSGDEWFVGGITNEEERVVDIALDFLDEGTAYEATLFTDGINAHRNPHDFKKEFKEFKKGDSFSVNMKSGGGFAIQFKPIEE